MRSTGTHAFTLVELLIVVAIIAILAAIATPNFLEAQTRSRVARVRADLRSVATAVEAYRVDANRYMASSADLHGLPSLSQITTPVSYISGVKLADPFFGSTTGKEFRVYGYSSRDHQTIVETGSGRTSLWYLLTSNGPDTITEDYRTPLDANDFEGFVLLQYDPTNGIVSPGNLYRVGGQVQGAGATAGHWIDTVVMAR